MARDNFAACVAELLVHEGGYVDHPKDPGGATNMGITQATLADWRGRSVTKFEVRNLTRAEAEAIYRARYWNAIGGDELPAGLDLVAFDPAVNSGVRRGMQWLQRALGVAADERMGPVTLGYARSAGAVEAIRQACAYRMGFLQGLKTWGTFGKGWSRRVARVEAVAIRMATEASGAKARPVLLEAKAEARQKAAGAATSAGGVAAGGGVTTTLADLPEWALAAAAIVILLAVLALFGRRRHEQARVAAFQKVAEEAKP